MFTFLVRFFFLVFRNSAVKWQEVWPLSQYLKAIFSLNLLNLKTREVLTLYSVLWIFCWYLACPALGDLYVVHSDLRIWVLAKKNQFFHLCQTFSIIKKNVHCKVIIGRNPIEANANTVAIQLPENPVAYIGKCFTPY